MQKTTEMKIEISNARIIDAKATAMPDGTCKLELKMETAPQKQNNNEIANDECILIEASKLSLKDFFMSHKPKTKKEKEFKAILTEVITSGIEDFYRPVMDPSFADEAKTKIQYKAGELPAIEKNYDWWEETVKDSKWAIGTKAQYVAFLGVLIKMLVDKGWTCCDAWNAVCNDSRELGNYENYDDTKHRIEYTGSREICGFFDLANTFKILAKYEEAGCYWFAGGTCLDYSSLHPLANLRSNELYDYNRSCSVAWLVLKKYH